MKKVRRDVKENKHKLETVDELVPFMMYESGMSFGDLALHNGNRRRGGTIVTLSDCYFAVITAESYDKLLKKDKSIKLQNNVKFLR